MRFTSIVFALSFALHCTAASAIPPVSLARVPDVGIQPQLVSDRHGHVHLLYYRADGGSPEQGHLYYRKYAQSSQRWLDPIQVSTTPYRNSGTIGRASMLVDDTNRIHVSWFKMSNATYYYSRSNLETSGFEMERSLVAARAGAVEAGAGLAAYGDRVTLSWHAGPLDSESTRTVFNVSSMDGGNTFSTATEIGDPKLGACACCGLAAGFNGKGELSVSYRTAVNGEGRHMQLLTLNDGAGETRLIHPWNLNACPVSTSHMGRDTNRRNWLVFETKGRVYQVLLAGQEMNPTAVRAPVTKTRQKHPAMAFNGSGEKAVVWGEGFGFFSGGHLTLQLFDAAGDAIPSINTLDIEIPDNSFAAVTALADGSFMVLY